jgi:hypothetical protein
MQGFGGVNVREGDRTEDQGVDGKIMLKWIFEKWDGETCTGSICFRWRALVSAVMNLQVP